MNLFKKIWIGIKNVFQKATELTKKVIPVAVDVVEAVKQATDSGVLEIPLFLLKKTIKGVADDLLIDKAHAWLKANLSSVIIGLNTIDAIAGIADENERVVAILNYYKTATKNEKAQFYSGLAAQAAAYLSDGKLSVNEAFMLAKSYYDEIKKEVK